MPSVRQVALYPLILRHPIKAIHRLAVLGNVMVPSSLIHCGKTLRPPLVHHSHPRDCYINIGINRIRTVRAGKPALFTSPFEVLCSGKLYVPSPLSSETHLLLLYSTKDTSAIDESSPSMSTQRQRS
ncbi:hypothetical protein OK016_22165 [Vibrio chagasii]|nr:hypothetical protein [Vibrio chagasii]